MIQPAIAIGSGAVAGALARYYLTIGLGELASRLWPLGATLPMGTFLVNLLGSFGMGAIAALIGQQVLRLSPELTLLMTVGFLGSFTTFSSYILDTVKLMAEGRSHLALLYWLGSPVCGFLGLQGGMRASQWLAGVMGKG
ncbi:MAG: fluoride efflux transporter CrcB [Cyanobacteria bacterium P01_G01_bin.54]